MRNGTSPRFIMPDYLLNFTCEFSVDYPWALPTLQPHPESLIILENP
jgi:hypothetical protein